MDRHSEEYKKARAALFSSEHYGPLCELVSEVLGVEKHVIDNVAAGKATLQEQSAVTAISVILGTEHADD